MTLRRLLPDPTQLTLEELYQGLLLDDPAPGRPAHVALCLVASADGAVAVDGLSGGLGGPADLRALSQLRAANDVSLVGAGTVRDENYVPLTGPPERRADRVAKGLRPVPRLAIVTASGRLDPELDVFSDPAEPPIVLTSRAADADRLAAIGDRAEVHVVAETRLDAATIVTTLAELGLPRVLCEGGPRLNQVLLAGGHLDELFLTLAPTLVGGPAPRIITGDVEAATPLELVSVYEHEGDLLLRYRRA
ncbi:MAG: dihydrofolate reductase family protein [Nitriliruptoraceae bacterium]